MHACSDDSQTSELDAHRIKEKKNSLSCVSKLSLGGGGSGSPLPRRACREVDLHCAPYTRLTTSYPDFHASTQRNAGFSHRSIGITHVPIEHTLYSCTAPHTVTCGTVWCGGGGAAARLEGSGRLHSGQRHKFLALVTPGTRGQMTIPSHSSPAGSSSSSPLSGQAGGYVSTRPPTNRTISHSHLCGVHGPCLAVSSIFVCI